MVMMAVYQATDVGYKAVSTMGLAAVYTSVKARTSVVATKSKLWRSSISYTEPPQCRHTCHSQVLGSQNCSQETSASHCLEAMSNCLLSSPVQSSHGGMRFKDATATDNKVTTDI